MPDIQIAPKLTPLLTKRKRFKVAIGGRSSGKSTGFANLLLMKVQTEEADLLCLREFQHSIAQSVHKLLKNTIEKTGADGFHVLDSKIVTDKNEIIFNGMARNPSAIKSAEDFKYSWVEEAQTCSQESLDDLLPTIRAEGSELWFSANPGSSEDPFSQRFIVPFKDQLDRDGYYEDDLHLIIKVNWRDNPWHTKELEQQRLYDYQNLPRAKYDWIWEGEFNDQVENSIILPEWFDAAIDAHKTLGFKARGEKVLAHDPSDQGGDYKGLAMRHGVVVTDVQENPTGDVNEGCDWALDYAISNHANRFIWDADGMGAALKRQINKSLTIPHEMFKGSEQPDDPDKVYMPTDNDDPKNRRTNRDTFWNKRAQYYWGLRDRFYNTYRAINGEYIDPDDLISLSSEIKSLTKLRSEICRIPQEPNGSGRIKIMSKPAMKQKHKIPSPNMADAIMMAWAVTKRKRHQGPSPQPLIKVI